MRQQESVPVPRGWTGGAAWKGAGASLLLHLFVGAAVIVALSGPPKAPPQVVDLTLLPPAEIDRRPVAPAFATAEPPGTAVLPEPPALPASPTVANPTDVTAPANPSDPAANRSAPAPGSPHAPAAASPTTGQGPVMAAAGSPPGTSGAGSPRRGTSPGSATPSSARSPTRRRRAGWGGRGRSWSPSSSSRTARCGTCGSCRARGTPPWTGERSTRSETPPRSPGPPSRRRSSPRSSIG